MQVDGYSLDAQRDKLRKYAAYEDMIVAGEYSDEGFSGKNIQGRQEFQWMLNDIQDGTFAGKWIAENKNGRCFFNASRSILAKHQMETVGAELRRNMLWGSDTNLDTASN